MVECKADTLSDVSSSPGLSKSFLGFLRGFDSSDVIRIYKKSLIKLRLLLHMQLARNLSLSSPPWAKEVVCSIQVSEFLFCFQLSSVSSTDAIFFPLQNILAQFHVFSSQIFPFWTLMEKNSHFSISVLFFWPQNSAKINYATNFAIAKNLTLAKILYWGLSVIKIITRIVSSNCICEFFKRQLMLLALLHCI